MNEQVQPAGDPLFNPLAPDFIRNPYPHYDRLRTIDPIHVTPFGQFVASRHADVSLVMRDKRFGKDFVGNLERRYGNLARMEEPAVASLGRTMLVLDPPEAIMKKELV